MALLVNVRPIPARFGGGASAGTGNRAGRGVAMGAIRYLNSRWLDAAVIVGAAGLGWLVSGGVASITHNAATRSTDASNLNSPHVKEILHRKLEGLHPGDSIVEVPLWTIDGGEPVLLADLMAGGGCFVLIRPRCSACLDALADLESRTKGVALQIVVIIDDPAGIDAWRQSNIAARIPFPVFCDWEGRLTRDHRVLASMA